MEGKIFVLAGIVIAYIGLGAVFWAMVQQGTIPHLEPPKVEQGLVNLSPGLEQSYFKSLEDAKSFVNNELEREGYVMLNLFLDENENLVLLDDNTNSEAVSYYLLWSAMEGNKRNFDTALRFMEKRMMHPNFGYLMWKLNTSLEPEGDGINIASDADLRAIKALMIAEDKWGDEWYGRIIEQLARGLEEVAITSDTMLAPYGGASGEDSTWTGQEVWLSYMDFTAVKELARKYGEPWQELYENMKNATLGAQIHNGLYNSQLTQGRQYGNGIDGGGYSINSMWIMVRAAESDDPELQESARKSLAFYKEKFEDNAEIYAEYSSDGHPLSPTDTPWAYALVGRAAVELGDERFSDAMISMLQSHQVTNQSSPIYGAFPEEYNSSLRVGQFTMQESIITLSDYRMLKQKGDSGRSAG